MSETKLPEAVALRYDSKRDLAPRILAKGRGELGRKIMEVAKAHGIPTVEDATLVSVLARLELDQEIPPALYVAVAQVLAFVYRMKGELR